MPLRSDPPPHLLATWWLRYLLVITMIVCIGVVVMTEYGTGPGGVVDAPLVIAPHVLAAVLLVAWSMCAMFDADRLVPATHYHRGSSCLLVALLWCLAFAAPIGFVAVFSGARGRFDDPDGDMQAVAVSVLSGAVAVLLVWLPFGYLAGQAHRIGAPGRAVVLWFFGSILAAVGSTAIVAHRIARHARRFGDDLGRTGVADRRRLRGPGVRLRTFDVARDDRVRRGHRPSLAALAFGVGHDPARTRVTTRART